MPVFLMFRKKLNKFKKAARAEAKLVYNSTGIDLVAGASHPRDLLAGRAVTSTLELERKLAASKPLVPKARTTKDMDPSGNQQAGTAGSSGSTVTVEAAVATPQSENPVLITRSLVEASQSGDGENKSQSRDSGEYMNICEAILKLWYYPGSKSCGLCIFVIFEEHCNL